MESLKKKIEDAVKDITKELFDIELEIILEEPKEESFGDYTTNFLFKLAKQLGKSPKEIGDEISLRLQEKFEKEIEALEVAGGFLNIKISSTSLGEILEYIRSKPDEFGKNNYGQGKRVNLEFVSTNPTGPLVVVNARAATVGDSLKRIMSFSGFSVDSEFYVNDAGGQFQRLEESVLARIKELEGEEVEFPEDGYPGEYLIDIAKEIIEKGEIENAGRYAVERLHSMQMKTLERFRVKFDNVIKESEIRASHFPEQVRKILEDKGLIYEEEGAIFFKSTQFGDEKDRVLIRRTGEPTYFFFDLAYHLHKHSRGYDLLIDIWGPDHHGYIKRMEAGLEALGIDDEKFKVLIIQQVNIIKGGERVRMSKRKGEFYTMDELLDEVGVDAARFFFLMRTVSAHLDFDLDLAKTIGSENPVYYVQYSHARIESLLDFAGEKGLTYKNGDYRKLTMPEERSLMRKILYFPDILEAVSRTLEPHLLVRYLLEISELYHNYYQKIRIVTDDKDLSEARLLLSYAVKSVVKNGLNLIGVTAPERM